MKCKNHPLTELNENPNIGVGWCPICEDTVDLEEPEEKKTSNLLNRMIVSRYDLDIYFLNYDEEFY